MSFRPTPQASPTVCSRSAHPTGSAKATPSTFCSISTPRTHASLRTAKQRERKPTSISFRAPAGARNDIDVGFRSLCFAVRKEACVLGVDIEQNVEGVAFAEPVGCAEREQTVGEACGVGRNDIQHM